MQYSAQADAPVGDAQTIALRGQLEALVQGLGMVLIELGVFYTKSRKDTPNGVVGTAQVRAVVYKPGVLGTTDCSRVHHAILPKLEEAFPGRELSVEVSTPGITRQVKDGVELAHYRGRGVRLWRTDISDWSVGILEAADEQGITIKGKEGAIRLDYALVAKAKLDPSQEEYIGH
ncbi:MAG: ribosome assembly cofactor RimP [Treponema sp.]|nr:ribosome assembly cofactor RimP [Treponema sp.]